MRLSWTRRSFLKLLGLTAGSAALGFGAWSCNADDDSPAADSTAPLTEAELARVVALSVALFEPEDEGERTELERTIRWWAAGRTTRGGHLGLYRRGLTRANASQDSTATDDDPAAALEKEILEGIYSTAIGWKSLGYTTWPGVPSATLEYTTAPHPPSRVVTPGAA